MSTQEERGAIRRSVMFVVLLVGLVVVGAAVWSARTSGPPPSVEWPRASAKSQGFDEAALRVLAESLAAHQTKALIVARNGRLVFEWYADDFSPNRRHYTAAMAKGLVGSPTLISAASDGLLSLDDRAAEWVPAWQGDSVRSRVTLRQLAFHESGIDNVEFEEGQEGELPGWYQYYYDHPAERFRLAIDSTTFLFEPGEGFSYSGVGFYVLSYVVTRALQAREPAVDIPTYVDTEVYGPIGIPRSAWSVGYARSDTIAGLPLTHFGSGGEITARAAARVGQLMLQRGCWDGRQVLDADIVDLMLGRGAASPVWRGDDSPPGPAAVGGWWSNANGAWPSAPPEAFAATGNGHEIVFVDPTRRLVAVRMGNDLRPEDQRSDDDSFEPAFDQYFLAPLYAALEERSGGRSNPVAETPREAGAGAGSCSG